MTRFVKIEENGDSISSILRHGCEKLLIVSRHGLGDNIFASPCFDDLRKHCRNLYFCSSVNSYSTIFHESKIITPLYCGGTNGNDLSLNSADGFINHFQRLSLDLGEEVHVYHYGLFEPSLPYSHPQAFVKGRRNFIEFWGQGPDATDIPKYHIAPDSTSKQYIESVIGRWLPERSLLCIARYGHTDGGKNFGDSYDKIVQLVDIVERQFPGRYKWLSLDYFPAHTTADGHRLNIRSVFGFLPCDSASLVHILMRSKVLITVPTGAMLVGAAIPGLKMITLWNSMTPLHFLDPQWSENPVFAIIASQSQISTDFMASWTIQQRDAVLSRWSFSTGEITPEYVAKILIGVLNG